MLSLSGANEVDYAPPSDTRVEEPANCRQTAPSQVIDPKALVRDLNAFRSPQLGRSFWELASTVIPFVGLCGVMLMAVDAGYLLALLLTVPAGLFLLRLFLIQHDCGHGSFLPSRSANDWIGRALGVLTLTPYECWRRSHALHHASTGNLDGRGFGDVDTLTVREYQARSRWGRLAYRIYRHPLVMFGVGPAYLFLLRHRLPVGLMKERKYWLSAMGSNLATALTVVALAFFFGIATVAMVFVPIVLVAGSIGVWLFYVQHQFEEAHWDYDHSWSFHDAALRGSSHLELPLLLRWFTANIGVHHVHHLVSRIPFYRLPEVLRAHPQLTAVNRLTPLDTLATLRLALWDEDQRRMVAFPKAVPAT
jgi:acyl-lipid omega-6 desaturase (Delta-12 desaturase)